MKIELACLSGLIAALSPLAALSQGDARVPAQAQMMSTSSRFLPPKARVGRFLFNDTRLSEPAGQSCASCHDANVAFTDPDKRIPTSQGVNPRLFGKRNAPTAMYAAYSPVFHYDAEEGVYEGGQFLDGRAANLQDQAEGPFLNPLEMANEGKEQVVDKVRAAPYAELFKDVYGWDVFADPEAAYQDIADAIAAFENTRTFNRFTSKYDAWQAGKAELTAQEQHGLELFEAEDKGNCAACHPSRTDDEGTPPLFTDFTYDNLGVPRNPRNPFYTALM
jgi:cytochrome c peroxidase